MQEGSGTLYVTKIASAQRQLNAAIRMFFAREDELAVHTLVSAAFRVLRDLTKKRGQNADAQFLEQSVFALAKDYVNGMLPSAVRKDFEETSLWPLIVRIAEDMRSQGDQFDHSHIEVFVPRNYQLFRANAANFLKHADRDADRLLQISEVNNEELIGATINACWNLLPELTPEMTAWFVFITERDRFPPKFNSEEQALFDELRRVGGDARYEICSEFLKKRSSHKPPD